MKRNVREMFVMFLFLAFSVMFSQVALAAILYVPDQFPTIQSGIDASMNGDTVIVRDGVYSGAGNKNLRFNGRKVTLRSENGPDHCLIDMSSISDSDRVVIFQNETQETVFSGFTISGKNVVNSGSVWGMLILVVNANPTIANCRINNNHTDAPWGATIFVLCGSPTITNCTITGNSGGSFGGGIAVESYWPFVECSVPSTPLIVGCTISDNYSESWGGGIFIRDSSPTISGCAIQRNSTGISLYSNSHPVVVNSLIEGSVGAGIFMWDFSDFTLINSTVVKNAVGIEYFNTNYNDGTNTGCSHIDVKNSIFWGNRRAQISPMYRYNPGCGDSVTYSLSEGGYAGEGNINADPMFVDLQNGNFRLQSISPCIDSGNNANAPSVDNDGKIRPLDGNGDGVAVVDMGAYEFGSPNQSPISNAGSNQTVHIGNVATLDGSGSTDPDGNYPLSYAWTLTSIPAGSNASLNNPTSVNPNFSADVAGEYVISLMVTDSKGKAGQPVETRVNTTNTPPVADAGQDQLVVLIGTLVTLDGSSSFDVDGDNLTYQWSIISKPEGSNAVLDDSTASKPTFIADVHGDYVFSLVVSDLWSASNAVQVTVGFNNLKPVASAGNNQAVVMGDAVFLNGSQSFDANGDALTYSWNLVSVPQGSQAVLGASNVTQTSFVADLPGQYVASLVVNDGFADSDPSNVNIVAITFQDATTETLMTTTVAINNIPTAAFNNPNNKNALTNKVNAVLGNINTGNYALALNQLQNDILGKTDGCATSGAPDNNDWITVKGKNPTQAEIQQACQAQAQVYPWLIEAINYLQNLL